MATAQEALKARQLAIQEVKSLLNNLDDLSKALPAQLKDYETKRQANSRQLGTALASQTEATRSGLHMLDQAYSSLEQLQSHFKLINSLCGECHSLIDSRERVQHLSIVNNNLARTLRDAEIIAALPAEAAEAERLLQHGTGDLLQAYERLAMLEGTSYKARQALESIASIDDYSRGEGLNVYFNQVEAAMAHLEERMWSVVRNYSTVAVQEPWMLVSVAQIIEMQEIVDSQLIIAGPDAGQNLCKSWRRRCMQQISMRIQDQFSALLQQCSHLSQTSAADATEEYVVKVLQQATSLVKELSDCEKSVRRCFPPHFGIIPFICEEYDQQLGSMLDLLGLSAQNLPNHTILQVLAWLESYQSIMQGLGGRSGKGPVGIDALIDTYINRIAAQLDSWLHNLLQFDSSGKKIEESPEGRVWTPGAVDLFRILDEQVAVVIESGVHGALVTRVAKEAQRIMKSFQTEAGKMLLGSTSSGGLQLDALCAVANSGLHSHAGALGFAEELEKLVKRNTGKKGAPKSGGAVDVNVKETCEGYLELSRAAVLSCVSLVYSDPGLLELFHRLGNTEDWQRGSIIGSILATIDDFMTDFKRLLEPELFPVAAENLLAEAVAHSLAAFLTNLKIVREEEVAGIQRDADQIMKFFKKYIDGTDSTLSTLCQPLIDLAEFLSSDSEESFLLSYTSLLEYAPGITPTMLSGILAARVAAALEMTKADAKEVMEACREVYAAQQHQLNNSIDSVSAVAFQFSSPMTKQRSLLSGKEAGFRAALNAARKRPVGAARAVIQPLTKAQKKHEEEPASP